MAPMENEIFLNQSDVAARWRKQISAVNVERDHAMARGEKTGSYTRRINEMEDKLKRLLSKGTLP